jgi:hypothetical protein
VLSAFRAKRAVHGWLLVMSEKDIRKFGLIALIFFGCLCGLGLWTKKPLPTYLFGSLSILGLGFILIPARLRPVYNAWLKIAHVIGRIITSHQASIWRTSAARQAR